MSTSISWSYSCVYLFFVLAVMDKRLVIYEHWIYEENEDTWYHNFESSYMRGSEMKILQDVHDFLEEDQDDISQEYYVLISITRIPLLEA